MIEFKYTITDPQGIHARPAGMLVKEAGNFKSRITIDKGDKTGDAKRIFALMGLGIKSGDEITIKCDGEDEAIAASAMKGFFEKNL